MAIHADFTEFEETTGQDPFTLQNKKLLKVFLQYGPVKARIGSMVAYQGDASFGHAGSGGMSGYLKQKVTPGWCSTWPAPPPSSIPRPW